MVRFIGVESMGRFQPIHGNNNRPHYGSMNIKNGKLTLSSLFKRDLSLSYPPFCEQFQTLDRLLNDYFQCWQPRPFYHQNLPWLDNRSALQQALLALTDSETNALGENRMALYQWLSTFEPQLAHSLMTTLEFEPQLASPTVIKFDRFAATGIPGRKWQQITRFTESLLDQQSDHPRAQFIDWCSGKGHLARLLADHSGQPVDCLEFDNTLCLQGRDMAHKRDSDIRFHCHDVLDPLPLQLTTSNTHHTALHACGDLHISMLKQVSSGQAQRISLAPCCYDKIIHENYQPLSTLAKRSALSLSKNDLHLAVEETVTGGQRVDRLRQQEQQWRLAFNLLQQTCDNGQAYLPLPSIAKARLSGEFSDFCRWAASLKNISLPTGIDYDTLLKKAERLRRDIERLELLRKAFQRPLELWLILDRALFLEERGYDCQLSLFCEKSVSPRNFLIQAKRNHS